MSKKTLSERLIALLGPKNASDDVSTDATPNASTETEKTGLSETDEEAPPVAQPEADDREALNARIGELEATLSEAQTALGEAEALRAANEELTASAAELNTKIGAAEKRAGELESQLTAVSDDVSAMSDIVRTLCKNMCVAIGLSSDGLETLSAGELVSRFNMLNGDFNKRFPVGGVSKTDADALENKVPAVVDLRSQRAARSTTLR